MSDAPFREDQEAVAIIGMAVRLPGARDLDQFWQNLRNGTESVSLFSEQELLESGMDLATIRHPNFVPAKAILADVDLFDASFFGISPREAELIDPQHRLLMECAWQAMEHAGYDTETYSGRVAVFTSTGMNTYLPLNILSNVGLAERIGGFQLSIFNDKDFVPTRIAYNMNIQGPGVDIGTACSSSLVSVHFACQNLLTYQCDMALVGAITVHLPLKVGHLHEEGTAYSPDGHCRPFDATPSGLIDGNGMAAVILKRLSDALADGDSIYAVVKGSAINNDGSMKLGYAAPSVEGQAKVIVEAQAMAGCNPDTITYVEAHGTATPLGDPVEVAALTQAFRAGTSRTGYCGLGSVKSNIGHVDKAAGLAGLIKTTLALRHELLPPTLHFRQPNPKLNLPDTPFYVVNALQDWPRSGHAPRRAGISSFGVGGTNAHAVLEEAPAAEPGSPSRPVQVMMVSAKTEAAFQAATENLSAFLEREPGIALPDVCYTLQRGRRAFAYRRAVVCNSTSDAIATLRSGQPPQVCDRVGRVAFLFPGQGSQYPGMARELYIHEPAFRAQIDECSSRLTPELGLDIRELLFPTEAALEHATEQLTQTAITQPALFAVEYALAQLWMSWGVRPQAMIGHSLGEYVAACIAGVFSLPDALTLIAARGRMMQQLPSGGMMAVPLPEDELRPLLRDSIDLAAVNAPRLCVVSGPEPLLTELAHDLAARGLSCPRLHTSHAFHSSMMSPILAPFTALMRRIRLSAPQIPYLSNVTGDWITDADATRPEYWAEQLRQPVRFAAGIGRMLDAGPPLLLEVGPGRTLCNLAAQTDGTRRAQCFPSLPQARERRGTYEVLLRSLADLWQSGVGIDWPGYYQHERRLHVPLPTYPFQRRRYWIEPGKRNTGDAASNNRHVKKPDVGDWFYLSSWKATLTPGPRLRGEEKPGSCLVFADDHGLADALAAELSSRGHQIIRVRRGPGFVAEDERTYTLDPTQPADFTALCDDLYQRGALPERIVYLWGLTDAAAGEPDEPGYYSTGVLFLVQALAWLSFNAPAEILVIANQMRHVGGEPPASPAKAALLGPVNTIPWEHPNLTCRAIDVPSPRTAAWQPRALAARLVQEFGAPASDRIVALRGRQRWVSDLDPVRLEGAATGQSTSGIFQTNGVYVVTGGLSDIGLCFARQIAAQVHVKLALTTTGTLEDTDAVSAVAPHLAHQLRELEALGSDVLPIRLKAFDSEHFEAALRETEGRFGRIDGIIHAMDMSDTSPLRLIRDLDRSGQQRYWAHQQQILTALQVCLGRRQIGFCMLMSSLASETGGMGQATHATASVYLDAFAQRQNQNFTCPWIVVNWDMWRPDEAGPEIDLTPAALAISPLEGADAFQRIIADASFDRILISTTDPRMREQVFRKAHAGRSAPGAASATDDAGGLSRGHQRPDLPIAYVPPRNEDEATIAGLWQDVLGIEKVGIHDNFFDLGGHSLIATQLVSRLQQAFQTNVELDMFFSAPTIAELAPALLQRQLEHTGGAPIADLLDKLEEMTEEGVAALLASDRLPEEWLAALGDRSLADEQPLGKPVRPAR